MTKNSSLYNMLFQTSLVAGDVLEELNIKHQDDFGRPRDAWVALEPEPQMVVLTRCGGHNRENYEGVFEKFRKHPLYISDEDDLFDSTYAYIRFKLPIASNLYKKVIGAKEIIEDEAKRLVSFISIINESKVTQTTTIDSQLEKFIRNGQPLQKMFEKSTESLGKVLK